MALLDTALDLASRGFRVFPLIPRGKKPAVDDFPNRATTDPLTILDWWTKRPDCNIGVSTTGLVVVDVDTKKGRVGLDSFANAGGHYNTLVVKTATGGYHCYFNGPDSKLAVDIVPGVDIRSHHGYVVGPGSVTSKEYADCVDGVYELVNDAPLAQVPPLIEMLLEPPIRRVRNDAVELDKETSISNAVIWLQNAEPAVEGQGGNDQTYRVCVKLVRDFALSEETAYSLLLSHWNHRCMPPWSNSELWALIRNAEAYGTADRGKALPEAQFGEVTVIEPPKAPPPKTAQEMGVYMGNAPNPTDIPPRPWKVERLLMNGDVTVLGGMGAAGKSIFELTLAAHWALGRDFGPFKLRIQGLPLRTMIYNAEDDRDEQGRRLLATCQTHGLDYFQVRQNIAFMDDRGFDLCLAAFANGAPAFAEDAIKFVIDAALQERADVIVFDPLANIHRLSENDTGQMRFLISVLRWIARHTNTAVLAAHHTSKGSANKAPGDADALRGSTAIVNSARVAVMMSAISQEDAPALGIKAADRLSYARIDNAKGNYGPRVGEAIAWLKWNSQQIISGDVIGTLSLYNATRAKEQISEASLRIVRDTIIATGRGGITRNAAATALHQAGGIFGSMAQTSVVNHVNRMFLTPKQIDGEMIVARPDNSGKTLLVLEPIP